MLPALRSPVQSLALHEEVRSAMRALRRGDLRISLPSLGLRYAMYRTL